MLLGLNFGKPSEKSSLIFPKFPGRPEVPGTRGPTVRGEPLLQLQKTAMRMLAMDSAPMAPQRPT